MWIAVKEDQAGDLSRILLVGSLALFGVRIEGEEEMWVAVKEELPLQPFVIVEEASSFTAEQGRSRRPSSAHCSSLETRRKETTKLSLLCRFRR